MKKIIEKIRAFLKSLEMPTQEGELGEPQMTLSKNFPVWRERKKE